MNTRFHRLSWTAAVATTLGLLGVWGPAAPAPRPATAGFLPPAPHSLAAAAVTANRVLSWPATPHGAVRLATSHAAAPTGIVRPLMFTTGDAVNEFQPNLPAGWGGRGVAADVSKLNTTVGIVASESGGLFKTTDGGQTWSHLDGLPPFLMSDVKFAPSNDQIIIATAMADDHAADGGAIWRSADGGASWQNVAPPARLGCATHYNSWGISFVPGTSQVY